MSDSVTVPEKFRKTWRGEIRSSQGFSVRIVGVTGLLYKEGRNSWRLDSEAMASREIQVVLYLDRFPDVLLPDRDTVVGNISRAFAFAGWRLEVSP